MMNYTEKGNALIMDAIANGKQIRFTRIELVADTERSGGELTHTIDIVSVSEYDATTIQIRAVTDNYDFKQEYYFNLINVYASSSDGEEVLFCYQKSATCPVYIPVFDGRPIQNEISIYVVVVSVDAVNLQIDGVYVLKSEFDAQMRNKSNIVVVQKGEIVPESPPENTWFFVVSDKQDITESETIRASSNMGLYPEEPIEAHDPEDIVVHPTMGLKIINESDN
ncbi:hypothetical protein [Parablautia sp. Marseille-Q6255]|uniref:hypothetical protein n=1 Tax=Parablautia sp. Marseille-Q6255 TaxID=3039593 RepID=UPI0024BC6B78|nr:hypothetical protein [Parablautia sp. Marseille-Q6255]